MKTPRCVIALWAAVFLTGNLFAQSAGLVQRVANSSLRMPPAPPVLGYATTNAFGTLTFTNPLAIVSPPGETNRLFVVEQRGRIAVMTNLANPTRAVFLDISSRVVGGVPGDERGLLGLAFHPGYATNRLFYVYYSTTSTTPGIATNALHERLSRFETSAGDPAQADANSELILIDQYDQANNHNGGDLHFGPEGYLYVSIGDEGGGNDQYNNSQRIQLLSSWITNDLPRYQSFADWQMAHFGSTSAPNAAPGADADNDGANNLLEYLTGTDPMTGGDGWGMRVRQSGNAVEISYLQIANRGFQIEWTPSLSPPVVWQPLDVSGNRLSYPLTDFTATISDTISDTPFKYYRVRVFEP